MPQPNPAIGELQTTTTDKYGTTAKKKKRKKKDKLSDAMDRAVASLNGTTTSGIGGV